MWSSIGIQREDGAIDWIDVHDDRKTVGESLVHLYNTPEAVDALVRMGDVSGLGEGRMPTPFPHDTGIGLATKHSASLRDYLFKSDLTDTDCIFLFSGGIWHQVFEDHRGRARLVPVEPRASKGGPEAPRAITPAEWRGVVDALLRRGLVVQGELPNFDGSASIEQQHLAFDKAVAMLKPTLMAACFPAGAADLMGTYLVCHGDGADPEAEIPPMVMWAVELDEDRALELGPGMPDFDVRPFAPEH